MLRNCYPDTAGEIVQIVYHGGSQPGTLWEIMLLAVTEEEVRARDLAVGIEKNFKLADVELVGPDTVAPQYDACPGEDTRTSTLTFRASGMRLARRND